MHGAECFMHCPVSDILQQPCKVETVTAVVIVSYDLFLFLAVLGLHWCVVFSLVVACWLLTAEAALAGEHQGMWVQ